MLLHELNTVESFENLRDRVVQMLRTPTIKSKNRMQLLLDFPMDSSHEKKLCYPNKSISEFFDFITDALPDGDIYIFGGLLRDMALFGRKGFNSDIDIVIEGDWQNCVPYLESLGARKNKFGGYRFQVGGWPIDIWNARETWAIKQGLVKYLSIGSLIETTVLNWDAILMNWRTRSFIHSEGYLDEIKGRVLDIVLEQNPNPIGMAVRVFRHLCVKDARKITHAAAEYLANSTSKYSFDKIKESEIRSYGNTVIDFAVYKFFEEIKQNEGVEIKKRFNIAGENLNREGISLSLRQFEWDFDNDVGSYQI